MTQQEYWDKVVQYEAECFKYGDEGNIPALIESLILMKSNLDKWLGTNPVFDFNHEEALASVLFGFAELCANTVAAALESTGGHTNRQIDKIWKWAQDYNKRALKTFPLCVDAQILIVNWESGKLEFKGASFADVLRASASAVKDTYQSTNDKVAGGVTGVLSGALAFTLGSLSAGISSALVRGSFNGHVKKLLSIFKEYYESGGFLEDFPRHAQFLLALADACDEAGFGKPKDILNTILITDLGNARTFLNEEEDTEEVEAMVRNIKRSLDLAEAKIEAL